MHQFLKFIFGMKLYTFQRVPLSISGVFHCTHSDGICHTGLLTACEQEHLLLLTSCQQTCMTYTNAVCTVKNSWWWAEQLSETCRVSFQEQIWKLSASSWFYCKKLITMKGHMNVKCQLTLTNFPRNNKIRKDFLTLLNNDKTTVACT
jgi:hypothetical protein